MTRISRLAAPIALGAAMLLQAPAALATAAPEIDRVLTDWTTSGRIAGAVVLVARDGRVVYRRAAGHADREAGVKVGESTIFRHASMSKLITSVAALALVDDGRLKLDAPVTDWLPWFTPALADGRRPDITIRQLMTHTAGLTYGVFEPPGNAYDAAGVPSGLGREIMTLEQAMRKVAAAPLMYEPGTEWRYSIATDVLGAVVAAAAGQSLPEAVAQLVTGPLGMSDTAFVATDPARLAAAYRDGETAAVRLRAEDRLPIGPLGAAVWLERALEPAAFPSGGGGMSGTASDYLALLEAIRKGGGPILSPEAADLVGRHAIGPLRAWTEGPGWGHGLGAAVLLDPEAAQTPQNAGTFQWGGVYGSHWFVDPVAGLSVVVLTNTSTAGVIGAFPAQLRDAIYRSFGN